MVLTSLTLVGGFALLLLSPFASLRGLAALTSIALAAGLLANLVFLPALILS